MCIRDRGNPQSFSRKGKSRDETAEGLSFQLHQDMRYLAKPLLYRNSPVQRLQRELRERLRFRRKQCLADNPHHVGERNDKRADQRVETLWPTDSFLPINKKFHRLGTFVSRRWNFCCLLMKIYSPASKNKLSPWEKSENFIIYPLFSSYSSR